MKKDYDSQIDRIEKTKIQEELFKKFGKDKKVAILLPSTTLKDLRLGYKEGVFNKDTKFIIIERGNCEPLFYNKEKQIIWEDIKKNNRYKKIYTLNTFLYELVRYSTENELFDINNCYFHFDEFYKLDLEHALFSLKEDKIDFGYFDFCGTPTKEIVEWFILNKNKLKDSEMAYTFCISGLQRGKRGNTYNYYYLNKEETDISYSQENLITKINKFFETLFCKKVELNNIYRDTVLNMYSFYLGNKNQEIKENILYDGENRKIYDNNIKWYERNIKIFDTCLNKLKKFIMDNEIYNSLIFEKYLTVVKKYKNQYDKGMFKKIKRQKNKLKETTIKTCKETIINLIVKNYENYEHLNKYIEKINQILDELEEESNKIHKFKAIETFSNLTIDKMKYFLNILNKSHL